MKECIRRTRVGDEKMSMRHILPCAPCGAKESQVSEDNSFNIANCFTL